MSVNKSQSETIFDNTTSGDGNQSNGPSNGHNLPDGQQQQAEPDPQEIFDARTELFIGTFAEVCQKEGVRTAIALVVDPKIQEGPLIYLHGHHYEIATILARLLRKLKAKIQQDLDT